MATATFDKPTQERDEQERRLDEMLEDSFPASDPSSSWAGVTERIVLRPYATRLQASAAASRLDGSIPRRDTFVFEAPPEDAAASVATAAGARASLRGGAVTAAVVLVAGIVVAIVDTIASTPLSGYATTVAMVTAPFAVALAMFVHTRRRWANRPVEVEGELPPRRRPVFLAVRATRRPAPSTAGRHARRP